jgi:hypothetical protein
MFFFNITDQQIGEGQPFVDLASDEPRAESSGVSSTSSSQIVHHITHNCGNDNKGDVDNDVRGPGSGVVDEDTKNCLQVPTRPPKRTALCLATVENTRRSAEGRRNKKVRTKESVENQIVETSELVQKPPPGKGGRPNKKSLFVRKVKICNDEDEAVDDSGGPNALSIEKKKRGRSNSPNNVPKVKAKKSSKNTDSSPTVGTTKSQPKAGPVPTNGM